jgi:cytidyltransferase-like protein
MLPADALLGQVVPPSQALLLRGDWKRNGVGVVCAAGRFDLLHPGHLRLLEQARELGGVLIAVVAARDGDNPSSSPITPPVERAEILAALAAVDVAVELGTDGMDLAAFLTRLAPDVFVEGGSGDPASPFARALSAAHTKVVHIPLEPGYSTGAILERITRPPA